LGTSKTTIGNLVEANILFIFWSENSN
jgi:hypothetical protein